MKDQADYSKYKCPYSHIEKECGHKLHGPEGYEKTYSVWCPCGFSGPVFCLDPEVLGLELIKAVKQSPATPSSKGEICPVCTNKGWSPKKVLFAAGDKGMLDAEIKEYCSSCNGSGKLLLT